MVIAMRTFGKMGWPMTTDPTNNQIVASSVSEKEQSTINLIYAPNAYNNRRVPLGISEIPNALIPNELLCSMMISNIFS